MEYKIITPQINWKDPADLKPLDKKAVIGIALHHMANPNWGFWDVHRAHQARGWNGIGYNFWVAFDGTIYQGRGFNVGAGVLGHNEQLISIGFQGDYEHTQTIMPDAQFNAGVWLINWLKQQLPNIRIIHGHKYWAQTACPGQHFPLTEMALGRWRGQPPAPKPGDQLVEAVKVLQAQGIINSPQYWLDHARKGKLVEGDYAGTLIMRMAEKLKGGK
ncbi:N-acetylmuramoyl-L-alanine amidase [Carboxydocella sporoproducens DSM 16521]|uniref:N-acetylmuramoyl-L-alanine amidase n=2 Tax=Carboxydocella TaxID=178898 RepID=A0A1T4QGE1_9FIRM|nr:MULTISPECIES: peptidoglycan recognition family protein [Carboxydocella]AVX21583.1 N-acetylmuramoyl-L-alanine amidase [Carboxydocella thermautotrophica]SKA02795.1 N-acetylmuramoyl-L-alanine amidase [Carboxydocella sporoproducens DSM 16521]